jgi:spore maturation protein CgeB
MKILLVGPQWIGGWTEGVERGLRDLGHDVLKFNYDTPNAPTVAFNRVKVLSYVPRSFHKFFLRFAESLGRAWEGGMNERLISVNRAFKPALVLILKGETIEAETLASFRTNDSLVVSWWVDDPIAYIKDRPQLTAHFEYIHAFFVFDRGRLDGLKSMGAQGLTFLPCAFDPNIYYPKKASAADFKRFQCDVGFVANYYPERGELLKSMQGLHVAIWGGGWKYSPEMKAYPKGTLRGKRLSGSEIAVMYAVARICPNVHHSQTLLGGLNMRTYEIPAAGGFQLVDDVPGLEEQFEVGKEIVVYKSPENFRELADHYLAHPSDRDAIIERGRVRVMRDHTYRQRLGVIFDTLQRI